MGKVYIICWSIFLLTGCEYADAGNPFQKKIKQQTALQEFQTFRTILRSSHPSLNLYVTDKKLNHLLDSLQKTITAEVMVGELFSKYNFITNEIGCSHTYLGMPAETYDSLLNRSFFFPLPVKLIENKLLVNVAGNELVQGTEIIAINERPVSEILGQVAKYESVEGLHRKTQSKLAVESLAINYFYAYGKQTSFKLAIKDTLGLERQVTLEPITLNEWYSRRDEKIYYYDRDECDYDLYINENRQYALLRVATFSYDGVEKQTAFENFCKNAFELLYHKKNIPSLIIDLRENTGGDLYNSSLLFSYLCKEPFKEYEKAETKIRYIKQAGYLTSSFSLNKKETVNLKLTTDFSRTSSAGFYKMEDSLIGRWTPDKYSFKGNIYVITNSRVTSAASYFSVMVKNSGVGKVVGEETSGGNYSGNGFTNLRYTLPYSKIELVFPYCHLVYTYKEKQNRGTGLVPDFEIADTYSSFRNNEDRQLMFIRDSLLRKNSN
ncbi:MAG: hypothetical protein H7Y86_00635 [Rhizobacter sp.]|nr:hypothetical protein [Ferruginibacter sp.]